MLIPGQNPIRGILASGQQPKLPGPAQFNPGAAGGKVYGAGDFAPTRGPVSNPQGYQERDARNAARRNALNKMAGGF